MERLNLRFCRTFLILLLGLFVSVGAFAQKISVTGVVKDQTGADIAMPEGGDVTSDPVAAMPEDASGAL